MVVDRRSSSARATLKGAGRSAGSACFSRRHHGHTRPAGDAPPGSTPSPLPCAALRRPLQASSAASISQKPNSLTSPGAAHFGWLGGMVFTPGRGVGLQTQTLHKPRRTGRQPTPRRVGCHEQARKMTDRTNCSLPPSCETLAAKKTFPACAAQENLATKFVRRPVENDLPRP
jgi:hypothetical protein